MMTHETYNELQKKMDKLASDFVDELAEVETDKDMDKVSEWLDEQMNIILQCAGTEDKMILAELLAEYIKLKNMLPC